MGAIFRCPYLEDRVGREMVRAMVSELRKRDVRLYEEIVIMKIVKEGQVVKGALGFDLNNFKPVIFECKSLILVTGGAGMVYANTDNPTDLIGDGYALALDAGVELKDMEFVQFYPMGLLFPPSLKECWEACCIIQNYIIPTMNALWKNTTRADLNFQP